MSIKEFLLARIVEDEQEASVAKSEFAHGGYGCYGPARVLAECAAKRAIIEAFDPDDYRTDPYVSEPLLGTLAAVYSDHADYRQEWAL